MKPQWSGSVIRWAESGLGIDDVQVLLRKECGVSLDRNTAKLWVWLAVSRQREMRRCTAPNADAPSMRSNPVSLVPSSNTGDTSP